MRLALAFLLVPSIAVADSPWSAGVNLGLTQSEKASQDDPNTMLALYGRYRFSHRIAAQLEVGTIRGDDNGALREMTGLVIVDLMNGSRFVPVILAGAGFDWLTTDYGSSTNAHHIEAGLGLEYRVDNGFVVGADVRLGDRSIDSDNTAVPLAGTLYFAPLDLRDGQYRSARITLGVHF
jgi:hypothetical protein